MEALVVLVLPVCLAVSFLCSGMEAGLFTLGRWRIVQQMREGQPRAERLYAYLQNTENFLWTVLIGNTIALFAAMWIIARSLRLVLPNQTAFYWSSFLAAVFVFYGLCDLLPKTLFRKFPNRLCLFFSSPFRILHILLAPLVALVEGITALLLRWTGGRVFKGQAFSNRNELRLLMQDTPEAFNTEERGMMNRVFDLNTVSVRQVAIPFARFPNLSIDSGVEEVVAQFRESNASIFPVWNSNPANRRIAGFIEAHDLIFKGNPRSAERLAPYITPAIYFDENLRVNEALRRMQRTGRRMAVVLSRDRREIGLVTLEEILKIIFGEVKL